MKLIKSLIILLLSNYLLEAQHFEQIIHYPKLMVPRSVIELDQSYFLAAESYDESSINAIGLIYKIDKEGNVVKNYSYTDSLFNGNMRLQAINNNEFVAIGIQRNENDSSSRLFFSIFNSDLNCMSESDTTINLLVNSRIYCSSCLDRNQNILFQILNYRYEDEKSYNLFFVFNKKGRILKFRKIENKLLADFRSTIHSDLNQPYYSMVGVYFLYNYDNGFNISDSIRYKEMDPDYQLISDIRRESDSTLIASLACKRQNVYQVGLSRMTNDFKVIDDNWYPNVHPPMDWYIYHQSFDIVGSGFYIGATAGFWLTTNEFEEYDNGLRIIKARHDFSVAWDTTYGFDANYFMRNLITTSDGGCLAVASRYDYNQPEDFIDIYLLKLDSLGNKTSSVIDEGQMNATGVSIYPNPGSTAIHVNISENDKGNFRLYNLNGQLVFNQNITAKNNTIHLAELQPGIYIYEFVGQNGESMRGKWISE